LLVATNGILAFTVNELGGHFLGHLENFVEDEVEVEVKQKQKTAPGETNKAKRNALLGELKELLM
jgi:hypothetical protein